MRRSNQNFKTARVFELLKIGSFKFLPPRGPKWYLNAQPYRWICLSNAPSKEQLSSAYVYSRYEETLIQDEKLL